MAIKKPDFAFVLLMTLVPQVMNKGTLNLMEPDDKASLPFIGEKRTF